MIRKLRKNKVSAPASSKVPERKQNISKDPPFFNSNIMPPTLKLLSKPHLHSYVSLTTQLSTEKFQFKPQLTSLYKLSTPYKFPLNPNCCNDQYISYASKHSTPYV